MASEIKPEEKEAYTKIPTEWSSLQVKVAVMGERGSGKSALINALRDVKKGDKNFAKEGKVETTAEPTSYEFPSNKAITLIDLPGYNTAQQPPDNYIKENSVDTADFYILAVHTSFTHNDHNILEHIKRKDKVLVVARTHFLLDVTSADEDEEDDGTMAVIKDDCQKNIDKHKQNSRDEIKMFFVESKSKKDPSKQWQELQKFNELEDLKSFMTRCLETEQKRKLVLQTYEQDCQEMETTQAKLIKDIGIASATWMAWMKTYEDVRKSFLLDDASLEKWSRKYHSDQAKEKRNSSLYEHMPEIYSWAAPTGAGVGAAGVAGLGAAGLLYAGVIGATSAIALPVVGIGFAAGSAMGATKVKVYQQKVIDDHCAAGKTFLTSMKDEYLKRLKGN